MRQRLAAILAADAAGYSRLMARDARLLRIAALRSLEREAEAPAAAAALLEDFPDFTLTRFAETQPFADAAQRERHLAALRKAGLPD